MAPVNIYILLLGSILLDFLIGDPAFLIHPVQIIGFWISWISKTYQRFLQKKIFLFFGGFIIFLSSVILSYIAGKYVELRFFQSNAKTFWGIITILGISSCLATKSLISSVLEVANLVEQNFHDEESKQSAIRKVQRLVSREVGSFSKENLLRYATESLTENSVDGIFGPLFWIFIGAICIKHSIYYPGPLSLGFSYKAISTLDSMIGYKYMPYKYLGLVSAKIEDYVTFLPCRLVVLTLPLVSEKISNYFFLIKKTFYEGRKYESPNAGMSEGIFAYIADVRLGGENRYRDKKIFKPLLNPKGNKCNKNSIRKICRLIIKLQILWIVFFSIVFFII